MSASTLERRVGDLEAASGGNGGCERCRGLLVRVLRAITGEFHSATWNGRAISREELLERRSEERCQQCGSEIDQALVIELNGFR